MQIQWLGQSSFKIQTKTSGEEITIAIDPYSDEIGLKMPKFQADIALISHQHKDHNNIEAIKGEPFVISNPGEYETKNVFVYGIPAWHDNKEGAERGAVTIFRIQTEGLNIVHLSDLGSKLNAEQLDKIGNVDILMIPVGGIHTVDGKIASEIIAEVEPRIVIPMHYQIPGLEYKLNTVEEFLRVSGLPSEKMDRLKIAKKDLITEGTKIVILNP